MGGVQKERVSAEDQSRLDSTTCGDRTTASWLRVPGARDRDSKVRSRLRVVWRRVWSLGPAARHVPSGSAWAEVSLLGGSIRSSSTHWQSHSSQEEDRVVRYRRCNKSHGQNPASQWTTPGMRMKLIRQHREHRPTPSAALPMTFRPVRACTRRSSPRRCHPSGESRRPRWPCPGRGARPASCHAPPGRSR